MRTQRGEAGGGESPAIEAGGTAAEADRVAVDGVLAREGLQERQAAAELGQAGQAAIELAAETAPYDPAADPAADPTEAG